MKALAAAVAAGALVLSACADNPTAQTTQSGIANTLEGYGTLPKGEMEIEFEPAPTAPSPVTEPPVGSVIDNSPTR